MLTDMQRIIKTLISLSIVTCATSFISAESLLATGKQEVVNTSLVAIETVDTNNTLQEPSQFFSDKLYCVVLGNRVKISLKSIEKVLCKDYIAALQTEKKRLAVDIKTATGLL